MAFDATGLAAFLSSMPAGYQRGQANATQIKAAELANQDAMDVRNASLASIFDQGGMDPVSSTIAALSGNAGNVQSPQSPMAGYPPAGAPQPSGPAPGAASPPVAPNGAAPAPGQPPMGAGPGPQVAQQPPAMPPQPGAGGVSSPMRPMGAPPPSFGGGQMSLGQMLIRMKQDPRNKGIPDATLLGLAGKYQSILNPQDRLLLQYMVGQQRNETQMRGQDMTAMYHNLQAQIAQQKADQPNTQMVPGMGPPDKDGKPTYGVYVFDKKGSGGPTFVPTQGAVGTGGVTASVKDGLSGESLIDEKTARMIADRAKAGDSTAMSGLGFGNTGAKNRARVYKALQEDGVSGTDLARSTIAFRGAAQAAKSVETQGAKIDVAANEMKEFGPKVLAASQKVDRTKYKSLNEVMQTWDRGTGGEDIIELGDWVNAMQNAYAQVVTRGGQSTEGARHKAEEVLNKAWSKGQLQRGVDVLMQEADAAMRATSRAGANVISRVGAPEGGVQPAGGAPADPLGIR